MRIPLIAAVAGSLLSACASNGPALPAPVPGIPVQTWSIEVHDPRAQDIYMRNDAGEDMVIVSVQLYACQNLKQECRVYSPNVLLPAGKTVKAMRLEPENLKLSWKYRYSFQARPLAPKSASTTVVRGFSRTGMFPYVGIADPESFTPRIAQATGQPVCGKNGAAVGPGGGATLIMVVSGAGMGSSSLIFVDLDAQGQPVLYTDSRGSMRGPPGMPGVDTMPPHTIISVRIKQNVAEMINEGGNKPSEYFTVAGSAVMNSAALGHPGETLTRVMRECGGQ